MFSSVFVMFSGGASRIVALSGIAEIPELAGGGEADAVVGAVEEPGVEVFLKLADLERHGRLRHVQGFRRLGEAQETGDGVKHLESAISHTLLDVPIG